MELKIQADALLIAKAEAESEHKKTERLAHEIEVKSRAIEDAQALAATQSQRLDNQAQALAHTQANYFAGLASNRRAVGDLNGAMRFAILGSRYDSRSGPARAEGSLANSELARAASQSSWQIVANDHLTTATFLNNSSEILLVSDNGRIDIWDFVHNTSRALHKVSDMITGRLYSFAQSVDGTLAFIGFSASEQDPHHQFNITHEQAIWRIATGEIVARLPSPKLRESDRSEEKDKNLEVKFARFSADGAFLLTILDGGNIEDSKYNTCRARFFDPSDRKAGRNFIKGGATGYRGRISRSPCQDLGWISNPHH